MNKIPVSLIIDDPAPGISVYHEHAGTTHTADGRPLLATFPNQLLFDFCDVVERHGIKGKFSVVPMPGGKGDILRGLEGVRQEELREWLDTVKTRLVPHFSIGPEMLTHHLALNLKEGSFYPTDEETWSNTQDRSTLTPYISLALSLLKQAGFAPVGATSPWLFGLQVEEEYYAALSQAVYEVSGSQSAWVFCRSLRDRPKAKPWVALEEDGRTVVAIPATTHDQMWRTIDKPDTSEDFLNYAADKLITADGTDGEFVRVLESEGWPILVTHWQSLMSNGSQMGLRILDEVAQRINKHYAHRIQWMSFEEITQLVLKDKASFPKPLFDEK